MAKKSSESPKLEISFNLKDSKALKFIKRHRNAIFVIFIISITSIGLLKFYQLFINANDTSSYDPSNSKIIFNQKTIDKIMEIKSTNPLEIKETGRTNPFSDK